MYSSLIQKLASTIKSMDFFIDDKNMAVEFLNGIPDGLESLISAIDALGNEYDNLTLEFFKSHLQ